MLTFDCAQQPSGDYKLQFTTDDQAIYLEVGVTWTDLETITARIGKTLEEAR